jgi:hypothetical protein
MLQQILLNDLQIESAKMDHSRGEVDSNRLILMSDGQTIVVDINQNIQLEPCGKTMACYCGCLETRSKLLARIA